VDSAERAVHLAASEVLFRGLRVRMGIGTGIIEKVQVQISILCVNALLLMKLVATPSQLPTSADATCP